MGNQEFIEICKEKVLEYVKNVQGNNINSIYVVWSCKTLQNNKALLSTTNPDGLYFEVTYNGDKKELYFDAYKKEINIMYDLTAK